MHNDLCDCETISGSNHAPDCATVRARLYGRPADPPEPPALVSWAEVDANKVNVIWRDGEGSELRSVLSVDSDIDGLTYHYVSGAALPEDEEDRDELLRELEDDEGALRGSEFGPIKPRCHRAHAAHRVAS